MVEKTVEVEQTKTVSEDLLVCDECHREVDDEGATFEPESDGPDAELHFCSECIGKMTDGDFAPSYVERLDEWLNRDLSNGERRTTVAKKVRGAHSTANFTLKTGVLLGILIAVASFFFTVPGWVLLLYVLGAIVSQMLLKVDLDIAVDAIDTMEKTIDQYS
jgi:hypothetical protein